MAEVLVSLVLQQLASFTCQQIEHEWSLVSSVEEKVKSLYSNLEDIQMVLVDADKRQVSEASVKRWLDKLKEVSYEIDTTVDEWNTAIALRSNLKLFSKVCFSTLPSLHRNHVHRPGLHRRVASKIDRLNEKLSRISTEKERYTFTTQNFSRHTLGTTSYSTEYDHRKNTTSFVDVSKVCGREREKEILIEKLLVSGGGDESKHHIIPLVGMGGIGKTTLAQLVYNDEKVNDHFNLKIWVCVSDPFDEITIANQICVALKVEDAHKFVALDPLLKQIKKNIVGKKFLLVLDDVWTEDDRRWEPLEESLKNGVEGSKILVTTRKKRVATMMKVKEDRIISISHLSEEVCLNIFNQLAFLNNESQESLKEIGVKIAQKCKGLPLVAKALGSLVRFKKPTKKHWNEVLDSKLWELGDQVENEVFVPFLLSYYDLPPLEKRCLLYCSIFPKDYEIDRVELIQLWMSQGYLSSSEEDERKGIDCFENLATRCFFQDFKTDEEENIIRCKMHHIVHDFVLFLTKNDCFNSVIITKNDEMNLLCAKVFHCTLLLESEEHVVPSSLYSKKNLRTLSIVGKHESGSIRWDLLLKLTCLRTLSLSGCLSQGSRIPKDIDKLILLRYLNLSNNRPLELPETLGILFNLQTLKLEESSGWLPKEIGKLVNLRHLYLGYCHCKFPEELGKLTGLQTLESQYFDTLDVDRMGKVFQSWMTSLNNLKSLKLKICSGKSLGPFGKLPSLESLTLNIVRSVQTVSNEFLGIEDTTTETPAAFPKLKRLHFKKFSDWIEWKSDVSSDDQIMPCLQSLKIEDCYKLEAPLPRFLQRTPPLKILTIEYCDRLQPLLEEGLGTEELVNILTSLMNYLRMPLVMSMEYNHVDLTKHNSWR
ncbi:putative disease resistance protein RGA3 [Humulus lupulus]|uniref:putative disease resistance protein RGA3 n=1 Tax=Humulus lupulus TaxID=3486 RepID=UPI002B40A3B4|nr:putative disease resistance protein RGA3 [Humulus lupulus]